LSTPTGFSLNSKELEPEVIPLGTFPPLWRESGVLKRPLAKRLKSVVTSPAFGLNSSCACAATSDVAARAATMKNFFIYVSLVLYESAGQLLLSAVAKIGKNLY